MKRAILACGCAALALAACSKKADTAATGGTPPTAATAAAPAAPAAPPMRKAGLWEQTMHLTKMTQTTRMCLDETTEQKLKWWATENRAGGADCAEQSVTPKPGGWAFHSVCKFGDGGTVTSNGEATGDFNSHYMVTVNSTTTGSSMAQSNGPHQITIDATWKGACPPDMKPGDIEMPGGMKINLVDGAGGGPTINGLKPGQRPSREQMEQMRAQAMEMAKKMKAGEHP